MNLVFLLIIPTLGAMGWALYTKYQQHKITDFYLLLGLSLALLLNVFLVHQQIVGQLSIGTHLLQMAAASSIVPLAYMYFAHQVGHQTANDTATTLLWIMAALTYVPEIVIYNPFEPQAIAHEQLMPFRIYFFSGDHSVTSFNTGDIVLIVQSLVTILRIGIFFMLLRQFNLHLNSKVHSFLACWMLIIVFIIMISSMDTEELRSPLGSAFYYCFYSFLVIFGSVLIAKGYDLYPVQTDNEESIEDLNIYVQQQYGDLATRLRTLMKEQQLYTDPQLSAERVIEQLNTNHTYFSQMMSSELGMSFSEYVNTLRLSHVVRLLPDESLTISQVAQQSGFSDGGYMSRKFKAKHGITPSEWRKRQ